MATLLASTVIVNNKTYVIHKELDNKYHVEDKEFESEKSAKVYLYLQKKVKEKYNKW